jgi:hypothetical protein
MLPAVFILLVVVSDAPLWMVNLQSNPVGAEALAIRVCAGLFNRDTTGDAVYLLEMEEDQGWLDDIDNASYSAIKPIDPNAFLTLCLDLDIVNRQEIHQVRL